MPPRRAGQAHRPSTRLPGRHAVFGVFLVVALTSACGHRVTPNLPATAPATTSQLSKQVLAFYYGWYGQTPGGAWIHWSHVDQAAKHIGNATDYPVLGAYDSHDPQIIEQHCRWAKTAGITGFIVSWWGPGDFTDQGLPPLLDTAARFGLSVTLYVEQVRPAAAPTPAAAIDEMIYVLERYGQHPAWLRARGKPVLFIYARAVGQLELPDWVSVMTGVNQRYPGGALFVADGISSDAARVFDGVHTYNPTGKTAGRSVEAIRAWAHSTFPTWVATAGPDRIACVTVIAGYDDTTQGRSLPRPITDRNDGETYRALWQEAIAANPDWVLICSWNEWHEGSEIEPSAENGERELNITAEFAPRFLTTPTRGAGANQNAGEASKHWNHEEVLPD